MFVYFYVCTLVFLIQIDFFLEKMLKDIWLVKKVKKKIELWIENLNINILGETIIKIKKYTNTNNKI